jgi:hypothetical protein
MLQLLQRVLSSLMEMTFPGVPGTRVSRVAGQAIGKGAKTVRKVDGIVLRAGAEAIERASLGAAGLPLGALGGAPAAGLSPGPGPLLGTFEEDPFRPFNSPSISGKIHSDK